VSNQPIVGIVLISHSPLLAQGAAELAAEMCGGRVPIAHAGGTDDGRLGTSIALLEKAVRAVSSDAGVAIIPDLGSSVLTARTFLEDLEEGDVKAAIVDAPFVESAIAAVVTAAAGLSLAEVVEAAEETRGMTKM
jgi:PTS hybrid protein